MGQWDHTTRTSLLSDEDTIIVVPSGHQDQYRGSCDGGARPWSAEMLSRCLLFKPVFVVQTTKNRTRYHIVAVG
jgi:hypothetical protein